MYRPHSMSHISESPEAFAPDTDCHFSSIDQDVKENDTRVIDYDDQKTKPIIQDETRECTPCAFRENTPIPDDAHVTANSTSRSFRSYGSFFAKSSPEEMIFTMDAFDEMIPLLNEEQIPIANSLFKIVLESHEVEFDIKKFSELIKAFRIRYSLLVDANKDVKKYFATKFFNTLVYSEIIKLIKGSEMETALEKGKIYEFLSNYTPEKIFAKMQSKESEVKAVQTVAR